MFPLGGVVRVIDPPLPLQLGCGDGPHSPIRRCSMSNACVDEPGRASTAFAIGRVLE